MAPANVFAVYFNATPSPVLSYWRNGAGHDQPTQLALPSGATLSSASQSNGHLSSTFSFPAALLPSSPSSVNIIFAIGRVFAGSIQQHGGATGSDFGAATINLLCATDGRPCVLASGVPTQTGFTSLDLIALGGFLITIGALIALRVARSTSDAVEQLALSAPLRGPLRLLCAPFTHLSTFGLPELLLIAGYSATLAVYLQRAVYLYPTDVPRAVGTTLAPAWSAALLPVARTSVWSPLLGVSYERLAVVHRAAASAALCLVVAHVAITAASLGAASLADTAEMPTGAGNAYGTAAATLFGAMAVLASPPVRTASFMLFKGARFAQPPAVAWLLCV